MDEENPFVQDEMDAIFASVTRNIVHNPQWFQKIQNSLRNQLRQDLEFYNAQITNARDEPLMKTKI